MVCPDEVVLELVDIVLISRIMNVDEVIGNVNTMQVIL